MMKINKKQGMQLIGVVLLILILSMAISCASLNPFSGFGESTAQKLPPANNVTGSISDVTESAKSWAYLSILLVFIFPKMREPIVNFLTAVFTALAIPFEMLTDKYNSYRLTKFSNKKK